MNETENNSGELTDKYLLPYEGKCKWSYGPSCPVDFPLNIFIHSFIHFTDQQERFPGHPADGQAGVGRPAAVVVAVAGLAAAEVGHSDGAVGRDEAVACGQVAVNVAARLEVVHRGGNLRRHVHQPPVAAHTATQRHASRLRPR